MKIDIYLKLQTPNSGFRIKRLQNEKTAAREILDTAFVQVSKAVSLAPSLALG